MRPADPLMVVMAVLPDLHELWISRKIYRVWDREMQGQAIRFFGNLSMPDPRHVKFLCSGIPY